MSKPIVIYGAGPFARLMHYYFSADSDYTVMAFTVDCDYFTSPLFCGLPVVPAERLIAEYPPATFQMFIAVGYKDMRARQAVFERGKAAGYRMINYISSRAVCFPDLRIGENNAIMAQVQIEPFVTIGDNNVFWSDTLVAHDVSVGNGNYFGAKCVLGGLSTVENSCFLGNGTVLINGITIHNETHALPGTILLQNTKPFFQYLGNPAREIGSHKETGIIINRG